MRIWLPGNVLKMLQLVTDMMGTRYNTSNYPLAHTYFCKWNKFLIIFRNHINYFFGSTYCQKPLPVLYNYIPNKYQQRQFTFRLSVQEMSYWSRSVFHILESTLMCLDVSIAVGFGISARISSWLYQHKSRMRGQKKWLLSFVVWCMHATYTSLLS